MKERGSIKIKSYTLEYLTTEAKLNNLKKKLPSFTRFSNLSRSKLQPMNFFRKERRRIKITNCTIKRQTTKGKLKALKRNFTFSHLLICHDQNFKVLISS